MVNDQWCISSSQAPQIKKKQDVNSLTNHQKTYRSWHETCSWQAKDKQTAEYATTERYSIADVIGRWHMNIRIMLLNSMQEVWDMK